MPKLRIALFIDAENTSVKSWPALWEKCKGLGALTIARCYGGTTSLKKWDKPMMEHQLVPMLTPPSATKPNASDFALTIDAVALLHRNLFDHAIIVSKDADFIQLEIHIREYGKGVERYQEPTVIKAKPAAKESSSIDSEKVLQLYREIKKTKSVTLQNFGVELSKELGDKYLSGHGTLTNFINKSGVLVVNEGIISPK